ncbi:MAG: hypothetical protein HY726_05425 [Candidatus Rokubacteria bacterium]|nr:hypothetical protein [Candidatus Rokubacteria bacterium]
MSRLSCKHRGRGAVTAVVASLCLGGALLSAAADVLVATGFHAEVLVTGIPRPIELAFNTAGRLVVLSHGWRGDAAAEIYQLDLAGPFPVDVSGARRLVIPFSEGPRKIAFGSLAADPRSGDLFLGEENGNRIYRLAADGTLTPAAVGLHHLVGGSSLAFDGRGRLVVLDFTSPEGRLRLESPPPPGLDWLTTEAYAGPLVFRLDPEEDIPRPRRLDLIRPVFPKQSARAGREEILPRFVSVAATPAGEVLLLSSLGDVFRLTAEPDLQRLAKLPAGHYHRTHMTVGADGSVFVTTGFHMRQLFRISPAGAVTIVARELGDPAGVAVDRAGNLYIAETALHRLIRLRPAP